MALYDSSTPIVISPTAAANAGCRAEATLLSYQNWGADYPEIWSRYEEWHWQLDATPARGWSFLRWEVTRSSDSGEQSVSDSSPSWSNPFLTETEETTIAGGIYFNRITAVTAVFSFASTGLILHSPANLRILHGAGGTILRDD